MRRHNLVLIVVILASSFLLIGINYSTIRVLSGVRAYISGESEYSKGQKDASFFLSAYIQTGEENYWKTFVTSISVPIGDREARLYMMQDSSTAAITRGFLAGRNHEADIPELIKLYNVFRGRYFMKNAIQLWYEGDSLVNELNTAGYTIHDQMLHGTATTGLKQQAISRINELSVALSQRERAFSAVLGVAARKVNWYLLIANICCIIVIAGSIAMYVVIAVNKLAQSRQELENKNKELADANKELDTFIYSLSHDLRAPIASIKGLVYVARMEQQQSAVKEHLVSIDDLAARQDAFIKEIIDFFRNRRQSVSMSNVSLDSIIDHVIINNRHSCDAQDVAINKQVDVDMIYGDELRLKMILNNLVSNSIKYSDEHKPLKTVSVITRHNGDCVDIIVADNGVGINQEYHSKIFDMFFVTPNNNRGTGLGLYILKQNVEKLRGNVHVDSEVGRGTRVTVSLPYKYN